MHKKEHPVLCEDRLRALFEQAADSIVLFDPVTLAIADFNSEACRHMGYTRDEFQALTIADLDVFESPDEIRAHCRTVIAEGLKIFETRHRTKSGEVRNIEVRSSAIRNGEQVLMQAFWRDVTGLKREEAERVKARARAQELEAIINRSPSMVFRWKAQPDFPVVFVSANVTQLGYTAEDFLSGRVSWVTITHPEDVPRLERELNAHAAKGCDDFPMEYRIFHRDGMLCTMSDNTHVLRDAEGCIAFYESVVTDVSERKKVEEELRRTAQELARSNEDLEQFAYAASHDLQEPLRMVTGFLDLLQEKYAGRLDADAREYIGFSVEGATHMADLVRDLLDYARVSSRGIVPEPVDLGAALVHVRSILRKAIEETGAVITVDPLPTLRMDAGQINLLFQNLIGNALKFRSKDRRAEVHVGMTREGGGWQFHVRDNGIGMDPACAGTIFQLFQRLHTRDEYPGTGIGLAICKKVVERHGGRIWVESQPAKGSTFYFTLPAR